MDLSEAIANAKQQQGLEQAQEQAQEPLGTSKPFSLWKFEVTIRRTTNFDWEFFTIVSHFLIYSSHN